MTKLLDNQILKLQINPLACIHDCLHYRKIELENLEHACRKKNHIKLEKHAQSQLKHKEPSIQTLARKYNTYCVELKDLIKAMHLEVLLHHYQLKWMDYLNLMLMMIISKILD